MATTAMNTLNRNELQNKNVEELAIISDEIMVTQSINSLQDLATGLGIDQTKIKDKSKRYIRREIDDTWDKGIVEDTDLDAEEKKTKLMTLINVLKKKNGPTLDSTLDDGSGIIVNTDKDEKTKTTTTEGKRDFLRDLDPLQKTSLLRKELKIKGQIGEAGQKDKLTYVSLIHQMSEAKACGYDDNEIVSSVIRAMVPSLTLRTVLETTKDVSLQRLHDYLKAHYDEKNAPELCSKLTSMVQTTQETPYSFVMNCIAVRQKLLLVSEKSDIAYDTNLVCKLFYRTLENGLANSYVLNEIKPLLKAGVSDECLIAAVTKATASEKERSVLQGTVKKAARVNKITGATSESGVQKQLLSVVDKLSKQVSSLQSEISEIKSARPVRAVYKCDRCKQNNVLRCRHCFKCGSEEHVARHCNIHMAENQRGVANRANR